MRVLHVVDTDHFAGVERHVGRLARGQALAGHQVRVVGGAADAMRAETGSAVDVLPVTGTLRTVRALTRFGPGADVVHVHMTAAEVAAGLANLAVRGRLGRVVSTRHFALTRGSGPLAPLTARVATRAVSAQIAISEYVAARIEGTSVVVAAGVDDRPDAPRAARRGRRVLLVQRLEAEKRADVGIAAFAASGLPVDGWELLVVGEGAQRTSLEQQVDRAGLRGSVRFAGFSRDVPSLMDDAAVMLAPSPGEHFGLSVLEAMAAGLPVVADGSGGHLETLGRVPGAVLYPTLDADAAGAALAELATDAARRDAYAEAQQRTQRETFTLAAQVSATDAVYRAVV